MNNFYSLSIRAQYESKLNSLRNIANDPKFFINLSFENIQFEFYSNIIYAQAKYKPRNNMLENYALNNYTISTGVSTIDNYFILDVAPMGNDATINNKSVKLPTILSIKSPILELFSMVVFPLAKLVIVLCFFLMFCNLYQRYAPQTLKNFFNLMSALIVNCISYYEVVSVLTAFVLLIVLAVSMAVSNDDFFDAFMVMIFLFVLSTTILFFINVGLVRSYYILNSNSNGQTVKRSIFDDVVNTFLCILRIFLC